MYIQLSFLIWLMIIINPLSVPTEKIINASKSEITIDPSVDTKQFLFTDHFEDLRYIKLETSKDILLGDDFVFEFYEDNIFCSDGMKCLRFNTEGVFLNQIGRIGKGPGEYTMTIDFFVGEVSKRVFILDPYAEKLLEYRFDGEFVKDHNLGFKTLNVDKLNTTTIIGQSMFFSDFVGDKKPDELYFFDFIKDKMIGKISTSLKMANYGTVMTSPIYYHFNGRLYYKNQLEEQVFSISSQFIKTPEFTIIEKLNNKSKFFASNVFKIQEDNQYLFLTYALDNKGYRAIYNKNSSELYKAIVDEGLIGEKDKYQYKYSQGFINDYDKLLPFWPEKIIDGNLAVDFHYAYEYSYVEPQNRHAVEAKNFLKNIDNSGNPIFTIARIKK